MALDADPYRILELSRGASVDDVKRAYRRLAKANHPDAAGEAALPRFLAIQAAYEQLIGGADAPGRARRGSSGPRRPWEADPTRSDATRRAYGGRAGNPPPRAGRTPPGGTTDAPGSGGGGTAPGGRADTSGSAGERPADGARTTGAPRQSGSPGAPAGGRSGRRRASDPRPGQGTAAGDGSKTAPPWKRKAATLGSTSYDGATDGPFEPDWGGASWYGTTSGTYWTLNPREYADPRKHGPEYQARARRAARARGSGADPLEPAAAGPSPDAGTTDRATDAGPDGGASARHTTTSWWESTTGPGAAADATEDGPRPTGGTSRTDDGRPPTLSGPPPPDLGRAAADITHALTDERYGGARGRVARAIVGWLPIALGIGWVLGELTGCGRFAATCDGTTEPLVLVLQVGALAVLLLVPVLASLATTAALALFAAAVVAALIVSATGSAADADSRRATLGAVLLIAWLAGLAIAVMRRIRALPSPTRPVS